MEADRRDGGGSHVGTGGRRRTTFMTCSVRRARIAVHTAFGAVLLVVGAGCAARSRSEDVPHARADRPSYRPPQGMVPDSATAIRIAEAVLTPIYGARNIDRQRPLVARVQGDVWSVVGSLPTGAVGGVAEIEISRVDGRILRLIHGR